MKTIADFSQNPRDTILTELQTSTVVMHPIGPPKVEIELTDEGELLVGGEKILIFISGRINTARNLSVGNVVRDIDRRNPANGNLAWFLFTNQEYIPESWGVLPPTVESDNSKIIFQGTTLKDSTGETAYPVLCKSNDGRYTLSSVTNYLKVFRTFWAYCPDATTQ